jgi:hypothetical protein
MTQNDWVSLEPSETPRDAVPDDVVSVLYLVQEAILRYPIVVQAVFSALVAEGRRYAESPEGGALRDRLVRSQSTASARMIWELLTANSFVERPTQVLPSALVERLVRALAVQGIEPLISRLFERRAP